MPLNAIIILEAGQAAARLKSGGKSGLHRARRQVTPGGRKSTESAAETIPLCAAIASQSKGEMVR